MIKADREIAARACFVRIGLNPDEHPKLLAEIQRELNETADGFRAAGRREAESEHEEVQAALAAAEGALAPFADVVGNTKKFPTAILEEIPPGHLPYGFYYDAAKALTKIREVTK